MIAAGIWLLTAVATVAVSAAPAALPYMKASDFTPFWRDVPAEAQTPAATVTPFKLKTQADHELTDESLKGHVSLVNFFFASCGAVCPRLMSQMQSVQKKIAAVPGARLYSVSVTPEDDSPERLAQYAKARKFDLRNWDLVTGDHAAIYKLGRNVFRADRNPDGTRSSSEFIHTLSIYLVDAQLRIRGVYQSDKPKDMALLAQDAAALARE
jgi:protein SCO1/2